MKTAMISLTLNAVIPMTDYIRQEKSIEVCNYLDEGLQAQIQSDGHISQHSFERMLSMAKRACADGAEAILLTCTVFTPVLEQLQSFLPIPVISADGAMLDDAAALNKRCAILCTFPASVNSSSEVFSAAARRLNKADAQADTFLLQDALSAIRQGNRQEHDQIIASKAMELAERYEVIILAQISMAQASRLIKECPAQILTSPRSALDALLKLSGK